jgi:hypothetical protein
MPVENQKTAEKTTRRFMPSRILAAASHERLTLDRLDMPSADSRPRLVSAIRISSWLLKLWAILT